MRILLFGGSFNPPHNGHASLCRHVLETGLCDVVWLMVSPHNPLKAADGLAPEAIRLNWARALAADEEGVEASDYEFNLPRPSYTASTLRHLRLDYPDIEFSLLIGADNWHVFRRWRDWEEILATTRLFVYPRPGYDVERDTLLPSVRLLQARLLPISSTDVRRLAAAGKSISGLVPEAIEKEVAAYYKSH